MSLIKINEPARLIGKRNQVENFFNENDDFLKNWNWDLHPDPPAINVREESDAYILDLAAPGMNREDFSVEVDNGVLIISATAGEKKGDKSNSYKRQELSCHNFKRSLWLPDQIVADQIAARYQNGILELKLPKRTNHPGKGMTIKVV